MARVSFRELSVSGPFARFKRRRKKIQAAFPRLTTSREEQ
jgi:hypothetical protein